MLFKPELVALILEGRKTQTRRVARPDDWSIDIMFRDDGTKDQVRSSDRLRWRVNDTYALQPGRGKAAVARIRITAIRYCARAADITLDDAIAEGFASAEAFRETYTRINGAAAPERPCWALSIHLVETKGAHKKCPAKG